MSHFMKRLNTSLGALNFYFNRIYTAEGMCYHVSVLFDGKVTSFNMHELDGDWKFVDEANCPTWIHSIQNELSDNIKENV